MPAWSAAFAADVTIALEGDAIVLTSDAIPDHEYGPFPQNGDSNGDGRPDNPNAVRAQAFTLRVPRAPTAAATPGALGLGPIGMAVSGAAFFDARTREGADAVATEVFDDCNGHPEMQGLYHYHQASPCLPKDTPREHSPVVGVARDGYAMHGALGEDGQPPLALDGCSGHEHGLLGYHYHLSERAPYTIGCYRGALLAG